MFVQVWPGTHRGGNHFWETIDEKCEKIDSLPSIVCAVQLGTIILMDGTLLHRGSTHMDKDAPAREVAYVSVLGSAGRPPDNPPPNYALTRQLYSHLVG